MKTTDLNKDEYSTVLMMQESWFNSLCDLAERYNNEGHVQKAMDLYNKGIERAIQSRLDLEYMLLGMIE